MFRIYIDADGCPVKQEVYRVADRYELEVIVVASRRIGVPASKRVQAVAAGDAYDAADDWIVEQLSDGDIVITADLLLVDRCLKAGARVLGPKGKIWDDESIGGALASRALAEELRQMGQMTGGPAPMAKKDRSTFLSRLDQVIQALRRA